MTNRRQFLGSLAAASAAAALSSTSSLPAAAAEPLARNGKPKFKFSLAAYSYRDLLTAPKGKMPQLTLEDFIADCAAMDLEGTELTGYYFQQPITGEYLAKLKHAAFRLGLDISGTAIANDFCHPPGEERQKQLAHVKQWVDYAQALGAPVIRVFSGQPHGKQSFDESYKLAVSGMEECAQYAGRHGVFLALENHGGVSTKIDDLVKMVRDVKSPWFGVNLDTGNLHGCGTADEAYADMAKMAPYALNVQAKVTIALKSGKKAPSDFGRLAKILSAAGYRGYIVLEYEESGDPRKECPRWMDELRKGFA
jgi:sugar phosphate isomerase/epimerase